MTDTFRTLCAELVEKINYTWGDIPEDVLDLMQRTRLALAQPEPVGPTDEELLALSQFHGVSYTLSNGSVVYPMQQGTDMKDDVLSFARAVLQRWGCPTFP